MNSVTKSIIGLIMLIIFGAVVGMFVSRPKGKLIDNTNTASSVRGVDLYSQPLKRQIMGREDVEYSAGAKGFYVSPVGPGAFPGVVLIHENRGLRPEMKQVANQLAAEGYRVLAVDLFGKVVETQEEARALTAKFDQTDGTRNLQNAVKYLRSRGATKVASLGWCFGGAQSLQLSVSGEPIEATVIYYGRLPVDQSVLKNLHSPVLGIFGDADTVVSTTSVEQFTQKLDELGVMNEIHMYGGVGHAFANPSGQNYAPEETVDAWGKTLKFLAKHLQS